MEWRQQWHILTSNRWLLSMVTWVPLALAACLWWIFAQGIARDLPIGVVDLSHSKLSYTFTQQLDAHPSLMVNHYFSDVHQASQAMKSGEVYAYVVFPYQMDKSIYRQQPPQITLFYNSQYVLIGKLIQSAATQVLTTLNAQLNVVQTLAAGNQNVLGAKSRAVPLQVQIVPLFNQNTNYESFLISAIIPALWQVVMIATTVLILDANCSQRGLNNWLSMQPTLTVARTLAPYFLLFVIQGILFLLTGYGLRHWPMQGSWAVLLLAQVVTVSACMIMGTLFYFVAMEPARAMSFAGVFSAPSFAFMGITFPASNMNELALLWRNLLPISHYIEVQINQVSYGMAMPLAVKPLLPMLGYILPALLTVGLIRYRLRQHLSREWVQ